MLEISDFVQLVSLPLEIIGLVITFTEVFFHQRHNKIQNWFTRYMQRSESKKISSPLAFITVLFTCIGLWYLSEAAEDIEIMVIKILVIFGFGYMLAIGSYKVLCILLPNRNLLNFGISLSMVGVFGEIYQVLEIFDKS